MNIPGGNNPSGGKTWPPARIEKLRELWASGLPASKIAEILGGGLTRNGVIGAARRAGCPGRQSPIKRLSAEQQAERAVKTVTKPRADSHPARRTVSRLVAWSAKNREKRAALLLPFTTPQAKSPADEQSREVPKCSEPRTDSDHNRVDVTFGSTQFRLAKPGQCLWILGETVRFHAHEAPCCGQRAVQGGVYCAEHAERAAGKGTESERRADRDLGAERAG